VEVNSIQQLEKNKNKGQPCFYLKKIEIENGGKESQRKVET
jgi:hypothetical protein